MLVIVICRHNTPCQSLAESVYNDVTRNFNKKIPFHIWAFLASPVYLHPAQVHRAPWNRFIPSKTEANVTVATFYLAIKKDRMCITREVTTLICCTRGVPGTYQLRIHFVSPKAFFRNQVIRIIFQDIQCNFERWTFLSGGS